MSFKIVKTRIVIAILLFLSLWLTYQYMESMFSLSYREKTTHKMPHIDTDKVTVTVFYECLCPDSKSFIVNHLLPSFEKASHLLRLDLVPYGKAETKKTSTGYSFECQHGPAECFGNKVHACVIDKVKDEMKSLRIVTCLMDETSGFSNAGAECGKKFSVDWGPILECARGTEGSELLAVHGETTATLNPAISFVPTILLNQNRDHQPAILKNLWKEICKVLPESTPECQ